MHVLHCRSPQCHTVSSWWRIPSISGKMIPSLLSQVKQRTTRGGSIKNDTHVSFLPQDNSLVNTRIRVSSTGPFCLESDWRRYPSIGASFGLIRWGTGRPCIWVLRVSHSSSQNFMSRPKPSPRHTLFSHPIGVNIYKRCS